MKKMISKKSKCTWCLFCFYLATVVYVIPQVLCGTHWGDFIARCGNSPSMLNKVMILPCENTIYSTVQYICNVACLLGLDCNKLIKYTMKDYLISKIM